jgi:hypothetical protein
MEGAASRGAAAAVTPPHSRIDRTAPLDVGTGAWLAVLPVAALSLAAILVLGPPLGRLLLSTHSPYTILPDAAQNVRHEPTKQARFLLALCAPALLALATVVLARRRPRVSPALARLGPPAAQVALVAVLAACLIGQYGLSYAEPYIEPGMTEASFRMRYFTPGSLLAAAAIAGALLLAIRSAPLRRLAALPRALRGLRLACLLGAIGVTVVWLLPSVHADQTVNAVPWSYRYHLAFTLDEAFAIVNGLTPLVNFSAPYASLWPFLPALALVAFGRTVLVFTIAMCAISAVALLAIYGVLRRAAGSPLAALALYVPFLATSLFFLEGSFTTPLNAGGYFAAFPLRYAGPFLLAWLAARHLDRRAGSASALGLFTAAGLVLLNNVDFGIAALIATAAALLFAADDRRRTLVRLAAPAGAGLLAALALVSLLTLARAGSLPRLWRLVDYARTWGLGGLANMPINGVLGWHVAMYLTYVAAIAVATVRALRGARQRVLTGMLAWAGIFGLGSAGYWMGRSHPVALKYLFGAWALAMALLTLVTVRALIAERARRPALASAAALFGFGLCVCSVAQFPPPWSQLQRLTAAHPPIARAPESAPLAASPSARTRAFVASLADGPSRFVVKRGAPVAILLTNGHRIADTYGVRNVSPYTGIETIVTVQRVDAVVNALRRAGGNTIILPNQMFASILDVLKRREFWLVTRSGLAPISEAAVRAAVYMPWLGGAPMPFVPETVLKLVDVRHIHPRALR